MSPAVGLDAVEDDLRGLRRRAWRGAGHMSARLPQIWVDGILDDVGPDIDSRALKFAGRRW